MIDSKKISYQTESIMAAREEVWPLMLRHIAEVGSPFEPDYDFQAAYEMEKAGYYFGISARNSNCEMVGYSGFIVKRLLHYKAVAAVNDGIFVVPEYRKGYNIGLRLIKLAEVACKARKADVIYYHAKVTNDLSKILIRLGYPILETNHGKLL